MHLQTMHSEGNFRESEVDADKKVVKPPPPPPPPKQDANNKLLLVLLTSVTVSQLMYLIFPIFGPIYTSDKHKTMNPLLFSIVASMYNLSRLLLATTIGAYLIKVGKKNFIIIGFVVLIVCCCSFAALELIPDSASDYYFFGAAIAINFIQGIGGSILQIAGQSIVLQ